MTVLTNCNLASKINALPEDGVTLTAKHFGPILL